MRLATYNVENLFDRAKALNLETWDDGRQTLNLFAALNALLGQVAYSTLDRRKMAELMVALGLEKSDRGAFVILRRNRGGLVRRPRDGEIEIIAEGRADWVGALELIDEPINERAMRNTAQVMIDVSADVLAVVEAESRPALAAFNREIIAAMGGTPYRHVMVIDGNYDRGIDVGLMTKANFPIGVMRSHVDDRLASGETVFSRDCPEFTVELAAEPLIVLVNHFKSKGYGTAASSNARRRAQAARVKAIYERLRGEGRERIAIVGDLNDTPDSKPLMPLLKETDLRDVFTHPAFDDGGHPGTYGSCLARDKIDYILLSPQLYDKVDAGGVFRSGMWPGVRPRKWDAYADITRPIEAASDHAALFVDLDI